jgi:hypothetical protein
MRKEDRKAAVAAYKERKTIPGIYAVRCVPTGQVWVGSTPDLAAVQNRLWFGLRMGSSPHRGVQAAWRDHGPDQFAYEEVERLLEEPDRYFRDKKLKERLAHWRAALAAESI